MKTLLCAVVIIAALGAFAVAQVVDASTAMSGLENPQPLSGLCSSTTLFYGGNMGGPSQYGFNNGNTLFFPLAATYGAVMVPPGNFTLHGICFNTTTNLSAPPTLDPLLATWDIRTGVSMGNGGTDLAAGTGKVTKPTSTGRFLGVSPEYSIRVTFGTPVHISGPRIIWVNASPQCTDTSNSTCSLEQFFGDNSTGTGSVHGAAQPVGMIFYNDLAHGYTWVNWCGIPPVTTAECARLSFGLF